MKCFARVAALALAALMILSAGCAKAPTSEGAAARKPQVITTLFPLYDFAKTLVGDSAEVTLLLPPGVESHAYEPTPQDIVRIREADVFIYTGEIMEPWAHKVLESIDAEGLVIVNASEGILMTEEEAHSEDAEASHADEEERHGMDPHLWLDPVLAAQMVETLSQGLTQALPTHAEEISASAADLQTQLNAFDAKCKDTFSRVKSRQIIYGGHFAFGYFARRYGLEHISPYDGFTPDAEPTPARIAQLVETLKASDTRTIYFEELIDPRVSRILAEETDAEMLLLHGAHNITKEELASGITYLQIMEQNLENLKKGLGYHE